MPKSETSLADLLYDIRRIAEHREQLTESKIKAIYQSLTKDLQSFLAEEYVKYADGDGRLFVSYLDAQNEKARFLREIADNVDSIAPQIRAEILQLADETYTKSYEGMIEALHKAEEAGVLAEVGADLAVNPYVLEQAINNNISKLTLPAVLDRYRAEIIYQIQRELNIGLMRGDRYETMARRISERIGVSESKARNIARTETHRNVETGFMDCAEGIQDSLEGSEYIYAATWRTMKDERVRPQQRRKTKGGWITTFSKNGANHMKMEGVTVKVGELFNLGTYNGQKVQAKCPSQSGVAAHDCNCRCFVEYNLMTVEEFAKATGMTEAAVRKKYGIAKDGVVTEETRRQMDDNGIVDLHLQETVEVDRFIESIEEAKKTMGGWGDCVDVPDAASARKYRLFLADDGLAGVAVKPDGDITAVFKNNNSSARAAVNDLIITARANGGTKMDCYGIGLVHKYERCGYVAVARVPFNPDYVTSQFLLDHPMDVYVMMRNSDDLATVIAKNGAGAYSLSTQEVLDGLKTFTDYDEALAYRDRRLAELMAGVTE